MYDKAFFCDSAACRVFCLALASLLLGTHSYTDLCSLYFIATLLAFIAAVGSLANLLADSYVAWAAGGCFDFCAHDPV